MDEIQDAVRREREYQKMQWSAKLDKDKSRERWISDIVHYLGRCSAPIISKSEYIRCLIKVMALATASIENVGE